MLFSILVQKMYARNLQYRGAHMLHNVASAMFGFIYISIWSGVADGKPVGEYGISGMIAYISFTQASLWIALFGTYSLGLEQAVRTGQIALDLMRPVHLFYQYMSREWGQIAYQTVYKFLPIYILYFIIFSLQVPHELSIYIWTAVALGFAAYLNICLNYLIGAAALWTVESRWLYWLNYALSMLLSGLFIPVEFLPSWLQTISFCSPYPYLLYIPARIYLGYETPWALVGSVCWVLFVTAVCLTVTGWVRRKVEVQGG